MLVNFAVALALIPFCGKPSATAMAMVDAIREPERAGPGVDIERGMDH